MSIAQELEFVTGDPTTRMTKDNTEFYRVPEHCGQCGARMRVKQGWKANGHDSQTGEVNSYEAIVYCSKQRWWGFGYHDKRALIFTPAKFSHWPAKGKKPAMNGLSVLTLITKGI